MKHGKVTKKVAIIRLVIIAVLATILVYITVDLIKAIKQKNTKETTSIYMEHNILIDNTEISIEELTNEVEEDNNTINTTNGNKYTGQTTNKNTKYTYYIKVNYGANVVTIYEKDENNEYNIPIKAMIC